MQNQTITKPGYKFITNIGEIPEDWEVEDLSKFATISTGKLDANAMVDNGEYAFFTCSRNIYKTNTYSFDGESLLIAGNGDVGEVKYYNGKFDAYQRTYVLQNIGELTVYIYFYLSFFLPIKVKKETNNGAMPFIKLSTLTNMPIGLPKNIFEQQKIAKIINTCDNQIEITKQIIQKIELRNKGLQKQLLTGKKRVSGFTEKWSNKHLSDIFNRVTRKNTEGDTNVLTISAQRGLINQETFFNKQIASITLDNYFLLYKGEFAYNKSYSNGYPMGAIKRLNDYEKGVVTTLYICFSLKNGLNYSSNFFEKYFESGLLIRGLTEIAHEGGRAHGLLNVTPSDFFNLKVLIPNPEEQKAIADILDKATEQLNEYKTKLEKLELLKKGLMQQLLTGKTRVKI